MGRVYLIAIWLVQLICLAIILTCSWILLDRALFALVAASLVLGATLWMEGGPTYAPAQPSEG